MRVGIDARALIGERAGIGRFLQGLLEALAHAEHGHEFFLYAHKPFAFDPPAGSWHVRIHQGGLRVSGAIWLQLYGGALAVRDAVDVFWGPAFHLPVFLPTRIAALVTVHDLVYVFHPQTMELRNYLAMHALLRPSLQRAQHISADSRATAADLETVLRVPGRKISVLYPGVGSAFRPRDPGAALGRVGQLFGLSGPYVLTVATVEPRKNLITLVRAMAAMPEQVRRRWPLVIAGSKGWKNSSLYAAAAPLVEEGTVRFLGYVSDPDLPWLYAGATLFLYPSLYEGFGIPVVEAMACGVPVVTSDIPVCREIAGDSAVYLAPTDVEGWAEAIVRLMRDDARRGAMGAAGVGQAARFTFEDSARRLLHILECLAAGTPVNGLDSAGGMPA